MSSRHALDTEILTKAAHNPKLPLETRALAAELLSSLGSAGELEKGDRDRVKAAVQKATRGPKVNHAIRASVAAASAKPSFRLTGKCVCKRHAYENGVWLELGYVVQERAVPLTCRAALIAAKEDA